MDADLTALSVYFFRLVDHRECWPLQYSMDDWPITHELHQYYDQATLEMDIVLLRKLEVLKLPEQTTSPSVLELPYGAIAVSANKYIGFGRTGTQEEVHVGVSPECCPVIFIEQCSLLVPQAQREKSEIEG